ncbi:MAG: glycosyltransferase family 2 protein [Muribaculaceae bacterium]|nr:glycosyltransferase family 2 protein [Muribaculaceae bacterium]
MTLDVAISTHGTAGLDRVAAILLPPQPGVRYVVSWQAHADTPLPSAITAREDVEVYRTDTIGLSLNRNNALDHCRADVVLIADNDVTFCKDAFSRIMDAFRRYPELDLGTFVVRQSVQRTLPATEVPLGRRLPKGYYVCSVEIALRRKSAGLLRFCPEFGLGAPRLHSGEDPLFLATAIRRGFNCRFFPIEIGEHPHTSTGEGRQTPGTLAAEGAVIALTAPATVILRLPLKALRLWRGGQAAFFPALRHLFRGALMAPALHRRHRDTLL